ncbi:TetR/AcrR family transcriptional regulator, mexJK operon transcriptional repressor [Azospirillaceae bacterium]
MEIPKDISNGNAKRAIIIAAAGTLFRTHGYGSTSMDAIARAAGVSKATLYAHFSGKDALFAAIVDAECRRSRESLDLPALDQSAPDAVLMRIGQNYLDLLLAPHVLETFRMVVSESPRFPELGRAFYESGPAAILKHLADYFSLVHARGQLIVPEPMLAAEQFLGMIRGPVHLRALFCMEEKPVESEVVHILEGAIAAIMALYRRLG